MSIPFWMRKPKHKETVIATDNGWAVERTGEILKSVKNLRNKLAEISNIVEELVIEKSKTSVDLYIENIEEHRLLREISLVADVVENDEIPDIDEKDIPVKYEEKVTVKKTPVKRKTTTTPKKRGRKPAATKAK